MIPVDSSTLPALPAPFWFVEFFKVLGFALHMLAMNIWFAGLPLAIIAFVLSMKNSRRLAVRMFSQLPVIMALGINFGIVPLLFIQTAYYQVFYTSTILMAWHWFLVLPLLAAAYYSIYICAFSLKPGGKAYYLFPFGFVAMFCLLAIAYIQVNAMSLLGQSETWYAIWEKSQVGAAVTGFGINSADPSLWLRYGSMFSLALVTSSAWMVFDANWLIRKTEDKNQTDLDNSYRQWVKWFATFFAFVGSALLIFVFWKYLALLKSAPDTGEWLQTQIGSILGIAVMAVPALVAILMLFSGKSCKSSFLIFLLQFVGVAVFAVFRQFIQNVEVSRIVDVTQIPIKTQWDTVIPFLASFVIGALIIVWMVRQMAILPAEKSMKSEK